MPVVRIAGTRREVHGGPMTITEQPTASQSTKIWVNSGDSHFLEPPDLWSQSLPKGMADRMPRTERDEDAGTETVHIDGQSFVRRLPNPALEEFRENSSRAPGARDARARLLDLDTEGIWGEVVFPSLGMWNNSFRDPALLRAAVKASNDWALKEIQGVSSRLVIAAQVSMLSIDDAIDELHRVAAKGAMAVFMPTTPPTAQDDYHRDAWEPFWAAAEEAGMVLAFHIGTDPVDLSSETVGINFRGPGGAILNYVETTYSGQRAATKLVASGALDRHPNLKVLISEGGATWVPFLADRMTEAYRQHHMMVRPKLTRTPREILYQQLYASFKHD
jgi:predicted TIM-barrel fold metal-dependent hydrolase